MKYNILLLLVIFILSSCASSSEKFKVGFLVPNTRDRSMKEKAYFTSKIQELGGETLVQSAEDDDKLQIKQAEEMLNNGIQVLVINSVNQNTAAAIVRSAHAKNVKVIGYDRMISNCELDYYLSFDNIKVGKLMADYALKLKPEGNYVLLGGDKADQNAIYVKRGQLEQLDPYLKSGKIKITYNIYVEDWSRDDARNYFASYMNLGGVRPDAIISSYDGMTDGAIDILKEYDIAPGTVVTTGQDAEPVACRNILNGYQNMTVYKPLKQLAEKAAEICKKIVDNQKITDATTTQSNGMIDVPAILLDPITVDKDNMKATVIADGHIKESDLN